MSVAGAPTWPNVFLPETAKYLADSLAGMDRTRVFRSNWEEKWHLSHPPADRFITLFTPNFPVDQNNVTGGGAFNTAFDMTLLVTAYVRLEADPEGKSTKLLEDEVNGVDVFVQQILTVLQMWNGPLEAATDRHKLRRPLRIAPGFQVLRRTGAGDSRWCVIPMSFECSFVAALGHDPFLGVIP